MKRIILLILFVLLILPVISAVPPFEQLTQFPEGYSIEGTPQQTLEQNKDFQYNFFLYNSTNGYLLNNLSRNCVFYMSNKSGEVIVYESADFFSLGYWQVNIDGNNFSQIGQYAYGVRCNSTVYGGTHVGIFEVLPLGENLDIPQTLIYLGLIVILIFLFLLIVFNIPKLPSSDTFNEEGILLGINNLKYLRPVLWAISWGLLLAILFITSNVGLAYLTNEMMGRFLFTIYRIMFLITLPMAIIWVLYIFAKIWRDREVKNMLERGIEFKTP